MSLLVARRPKLIGDSERSSDAEGYRAPTIKLLNPELYERTKKTTMQVKHTAYDSTRQVREV